MIVLVLILYSHLAVSFDQIMMITKMTLQGQRYAGASKDAIVASILGILL